MPQRILAVCILGVFATPLFSQATPNEWPAKLIVGTMQAPPFVIRSDDGGWGGLSIDLWRQIATLLNIEFEFRAYDYDAPGLLHAAEHRQVDVILAPLPVTAAYEEKIDFSHAYFSSGLGIVVRRKPQQHLLAFILGAFSYQFLGAIGGLLGLLICVGTVVWLLERRGNPQHFRGPPLQGIADGLWWAAVTMVTVGYGDKVPHTRAGRAVALVWMFSSIFSLAFFAAILTSAFTANQLQYRIKGPQDLPWAQIGAVAGTTGDELLTAQGLTFRRFPFVIQACKTLLRGEIETVVYDKAILSHMIKEYGWREIEILPQTLLRYDYAIALPHGSLLRESINQALLYVIHQPVWEKTTKRYFEAEH